MIVYIHYPTELVFDSFTEADEYIQARGGYIIEREVTAEEFEESIPFDLLPPAQQIKLLTKYGY